MCPVLGQWLCGEQSIPSAGHNVLLLKSYHSRTPPPNLPTYLPTWRVSSRNHKNPSHHQSIIVSKPIHIHPPQPWMQQKMLPVTIQSNCWIKPWHTNKSTSLLLNTWIQHKMLPVNIHIDLLATHHQLNLPTSPMWRVSSRSGKKWGSTRSSPSTSNASSPS